MSKQWKEVDLWPPTSLVNYFCLSDFKLKFPNTRVIVDGTECPIKKQNFQNHNRLHFQLIKLKTLLKFW